MLNQNFVILGVVIILIGNVRYLIATIKGKIQPNKVTWGLWSLPPLIAFFAEINQGVGIQAWLTFMVGFYPLIIFLASFFNKKAAWHIGKLDIFCGVLSILGLALWFITREGNVAIFFSILADASAGIPTIVKSYKAPESESSSTYVADGISGVITILTIRHWTFANFAFPLYVIVMNGITGFLVVTKIGKGKMKYTFNL